MVGAGEESILTDTMTVLVVGAGGFLGGFLLAALRERGWRVLRGVRPRNAPPAEDERYCDFAAVGAPEQWHKALLGVHAVVNAAGILRESGAQNFERLHYSGPLSLARACVDCGVEAFVQISALGVPDDGEFVASKHRFDAALMDLPLKVVVLRPSIVYSAAGSYGGTSLLRALAGFPGVQLLPGAGRWLLQPVAAEDLGRIVANAIGSGASGVFEVGGPQAMSLRDYQSAWRRWLRIPGDYALPAPQAFVSVWVWLSEKLARGPVGETMWRMLRRGNVTNPAAIDRLAAALDIRPRPLAEALSMHPSQVQDRWHAQLYFLAPALRIAIVALWLLSGLAGLLTSTAEVERLFAGSILPPWSAVGLARASGVLDLVLALWLATGWRPRLAIGLMAISVLAYTFAFGSLLPALWLQPLGGLAKNLVLLPALAALWVLLDRR